MRSNEYRSVPFSIGGVAHPKPARTTIEAPTSAKHFGPEDAKGFKPMFFGHDRPQSDAEAQLRLDWEQAAARMIEKAYAKDGDNEKGALIDLTV
ncbi:hypothetical protein [Novosphingobium malaysiense]|uniref:Uncharacterized protein n=1 Tax=Novosphingobium malaysiense TaxID=1348853 RepID=A0A0B1ZGB9_9SPHN|nr:hypothetical protein [Novosphingobium malaysiense]KHK89540.1 hypothetical protein LK12_20810 [Novosphingobium malaysiense]